MKKNLVYRLLLFCTLSVSLNSCRTDEILAGTEHTEKERIVFFERFEKERSLSRNTDSNNYAVPFGNSILAYFEKYPEKRIELENKYGTVDLKVSSQDMDLDGGKKLIMFPMLIDGKVTAVIGGVINAERDFLYFDVYKEGHPDRDYLIHIFQQHYSSFATGRTIDVGEVIIIVKKPVLTKPDPDSDMGGGHDMGGGPGDYGDGSGGGSSQSSADKIDTEKLKEFPCAYEIAQELPNLSNDLAKLLQDTFGKSDKVNITFQPKEGMGDVDGVRSSASQKDGIFSATIDLNADVLRYGTKEYILVTMYHETIHAYLGYQFTTLSYDEYIAKFPKINAYEIKDGAGNTVVKYELDKAHTNYGPFIDRMVNAITSYNPKLPIETAKAMAKAGVVQSSSVTNDEINKNDDERDTRKGNSLGIKCSK
ncbi:hypothetical protein [Chryseobacterium oncorhynchi]|uniref:SprT-like domain-containing protein n=1 Tax=Chryseobacterium oncorhynchi TaxID=741074 RepID=A0A316WJX3_9FLAO|nr:hypothetical protein [Chryseobacterium oncorhynchi]PWN61459.1 hypothetical protein C1638_018810 [Chryseobacterium oncorhynchi]